MNYPLISEYIEAIKSAEDNFEELSYLRPVLGDDGLPLMTSGNFAVVFKMKDGQNGKFYAVKCFTKEQEGRAEAYREIGKELENVSSPYILSIRYLEKELFVDTDQTAETEFPVLLMEWVEGKTLDKYLRENLDDKYALEMLAYRFSQLAQWLIPQPFAHGDLKPDNILVREDGTLVLVDYDGMYVPAMKGQNARELGSPDFRHPLRTENDFNERIDDFPIISILLSLRALSLDPLLYEEFGAVDRLLFSICDYTNISESILYKSILSFNNEEIIKLNSLFILILGRINATNHVSLLDLNIPDIKRYTEVTEDDLAESWIDQYGVTYSKDGTKLLKGIISRKYKIREGTIYICDYAFNEWHLFRNKDDYANPFSYPKSIVEKERMIEIVMPDSVKILGEGAFEGCKALKTIRFSNALNTISDSAFEGCESLESISIPNSVTTIGKNVFAGCTKLREVVLSNNIKIIKDSSFSNCLQLNKIELPCKLLEIENSAFFACQSLSNIVFPSSLETLGNMVFQSCPQLNLFIPDTIKRIRGTLACKYTLSPTSPYLYKENNVLYNKDKTAIFSFECNYNYESGEFIGKYPKWAQWAWGKREEDEEDEYGQWWSSKRDVEVVDIIVPETIQYIEDYAFWNKPYIRSVVIPQTVTHIGTYAFNCCELLKRIHLPESLCFPDVVDSFDEDIEIIIPKGHDNSLSLYDYPTIRIDYEQFVLSNLEGILFSKEDVRRIINSQYIYNVLHYLDKTCAIEVFDQVIGSMNELLDTYSSKEDNNQKEICFLLKSQKNKLELIRDSITNDDEQFN